MDSLEQSAKFPPATVLPLLPSGFHIPRHFLLASVTRVTTVEQLFLWLAHGNKMLFIRSDVGSSSKVLYIKQLHDFMKTEKLEV